MATAGLIIVVCLMALAVGGLFLLGQKSRAGAPPGLTDGKLAACPSSPNCVVSEQHGDAAHRVAPLPLETWDSIPNKVGAMGGEILHIDERYISAVFSSKLFGFVDDVEFRKSEDGVHVRSASRVGYSDRGVNRARVEALRAGLAA